MWLNLFDMKLLGCVLMLVSSLRIGAVHVRRLRTRPLALRDLADALAVVEQVSCVQRAPLTDAFLTAAASAGISASFFEQIYHGLESNLSLSELWTLSVGTLSFLNSQEQQTVASLKHFLGCQDVKIQQSELESCVAFLRRQSEDAAHAAVSETKLTYSLSTVAGLMLGVLLY